MDVELAVAGLQDMGPVVTLLGKGSVFDLDSVLDLDFVQQYYLSA